MIIDIILFFVVCAIWGLIIAVVAHWMRKDYRG